MYTENKQLYCFDLETFTFQWIINLSALKKTPTSMTFCKNSVILGMPFGKVILITLDKNSPLICKCGNCEARFPRMADIFDHFHYDHALPFCNIRTNYNNFFYCPWIGCNLRINKGIKMVFIVYLAIFSIIGFFRITSIFFYQIYNLLYIKKYFSKSISVL